jgi:diguanylate cyclase (GGDEF)-like protein/PAS domain S-box-containing protein
MKPTQAELDFHRAFDRMTDAFVSLDADWRYTHVNAKAGQLLGRRPEDLIGKHIWTEFPEGISQPFYLAYQEAMAEQRPITLEEYYPPYDRWFENRIFPSPDGLTIYFHDITERKQAEQALRDSQRMLDEAQHVAQMGSWEWNVASNRVSWSRELFRIYGLRPVEAVSFEEFLQQCHPEDRPRTQAVVEACLRTRQPFYHEERILHPDGGIRTLASRGEVLLDNHDQVSRMIGACQDVTERKRREQMDAGQREILAGIAAQAPLRENLKRIALLHEQVNPGALCSLLLVDDDGLRLRHGAAPSLPDAFNQWVDGQEIGDCHGSCGTAAWRRERVVVSDIASDPAWAGYRAVALAHGLRACWSTPVMGNAGQVLGTFAVYFREVREPRPEELANIEAMLTTTAIAIECDRQIARLRERDCFFDLSMDIYCIFDPASQRIVQANRMFSQVTGFTESELTGRHYLEFVHPDDRDTATDAVAVLRAEGSRVDQIEYRFLCKDGSYRCLSWQSVVVPDGLAYAVARDVTEARRVEAELVHSSSHDALTGLAEYPALEKTLAALLASAEESVWVLFVGLDRFQVVNESMGHVVGDAVLKRVAERLREATGDADRIARFAGDEFVVIGSDLGEDDAVKLAERLRRAVARPIDGGDYRLLLTASVGISQSPDHGTSPQELLRRAEAAMTRAKRQGRDSTCVFSVEQMQDIQDRLLLGSHLRGAIAAGELELHYQPLHQSDGRALTGFEALLRWHSTSLGQVPPGRFIPVAEALGLMPEIGDWVLNEACRQARAWLDRGHRGFDISVNISAQQLQRPGLVEQIRAALQRHDLPAHVLSIELTESSLMENVARVRHTLLELKALGTTVALDDFGTGYSSLAYLKQFPIDKLKIDQSFVRGLPDDADDSAIARTIVVMAHQLRMVVSAEGVETAEQARFLSGIGCDELQGYHLGRPVPALAAESFFPRIAAGAP